ncbi:hypothetical protein AVEN_197873-1 [Araneus ventricosus]|uniref:Uncharacterized protein n=1 Tax=Araneus ventricosus TaxID=182803 RepID=A0A4Y2T048_ARAVE|nr:hypothetical protein AVEN_197873-1 [Araneus ventricosus]
MSVRLLYLDIVLLIDGIMAPLVRKHLGTINKLLELESADTIRHYFAHGCFYETLDEKLSIAIEDMLKEEKEWMPIDEGIPVAATLTDLEIWQAVCEQDQAIMLMIPTGTNVLTTTLQRCQNEASI